MTQKLLTFLRKIGLIRENNVYYRRNRCAATSVKGTGGTGCAFMP